MNLDERIQTAQTAVFFRAPFWGAAVCKLPVVWDEAVPTAETEGTIIRANPKWVGSLPNSVLVTVLVHEAMHCLFRHFARLPAGGDLRLWNQACDHVINLILADYGDKEAAAKRIANPFPFPSGINICCHPRFRGMIEEEIYAVLMAERKSGKEEGRAEPFGEVLPAPMETTKRLSGEWEQTLMQSALAGQRAGTVPGSIARIVQGLTSPSVSWWELLRSLLREQMADDWDFMHPAIEYWGGDFLIPSLHSERIGSVVFATDTSGSVRSAMLGRFKAEKQNCLDELRPEKLIDIYCDAKIQRVTEWSAGQIIEGNCPGGGGTDFRPVWEYAQGLTPLPKAIVYLTDLLGKFGSDPGIPVLWVTWSKEGTAPFGEVIYAGGQ